jgi:hypothetical protein
MSNMIHRANRTGLTVALLRGILGLVLLLPASAWAGGRTTTVPPPNGVDDTVNIQRALDAAVANGPGSVVQLAAGRYLTQQLVTYNFQGTFKGMGKDKTTIEALPNLLVNVPDFCVGAVMPNTTSSRWPSLIMFVDGDIRVTDLAIKVTAPPGTATTGYWMCGSPCTFLIEALRFMGEHRTNARVEDVAFEGLPDDSPTSWGFNVLNGVDYVGELPRSFTDLDYFYLSGNFAVRNSSFKSLGYGAYVGGFIRDVRVTIGGSPSTGNAFEGGLVGMDMESAENSTFEISYNRSEGMWSGMWVIPWLDVVPSKPSHYSIHDNTFVTTAPNASGIFLSDDPATPWIRATIFNNTIEVKNDLMWDGIGAYNTQGTVVINNTITGGGADAIGLWGATDCTVIGNDVGGFVADPGFGLAQVYLDPATSHDLVVCSNPLDTVLDEGSNNRIIDGGSQSKTSSEAPTTRDASAPGALTQSLLKKKSLHR